MSATATAPRVTREILEDRWDGMVYRREVGDHWGPLMVRLDQTLIKMYERLTRVEHDGMVVGAGGVHDAVHDAIKRTLLDEIDRRGLAR